MTRLANPTYVTGRRPNLEIQFPVCHPAHCMCPRSMALAESKRSVPHQHRVLRASPVPAG